MAIGGAGRSKTSPEFREYEKDKKKIIVAVSGYFDPIHIGHIKYFKAAKELGDKLIVILDTDDQAKQKKGFVFMRYEEREEILRAIKYVDDVFQSIDKDETVAETLELLKPDIFAKGGDRNIINLPIKERDICTKLGIKMVFGVGGPKIQSSTWLVERGKGKWYFQDKNTGKWHKKEI